MTNPGLTDLLLDKQSNLYPVQSTQRFGDSKTLQRVTITDSDIATISTLIGVIILNIVYVHTDDVTFQDEELGIVWYPLVCLYRL